jgi:hypothetical protein
MTPALTVRDARFEIAHGPETALLMSRAKIEEKSPYFQLT